MERDSKRRKTEEPSASSEEEQAAAEPAGLEQASSAAEGEEQPPAADDSAWQPLPEPYLLGEGPLPPGLAPFPLLDLPDDLLRALVLDHLHVKDG